MKYVVLEVTDHTSKEGEANFVREIPFIFPDVCTHSEVALHMTRMLRMERPDGRFRKIKAISAGFLSSMAIGSDKVNVCHGKSESLHLESRPAADSVLIHMFDYLHGIK